MSDQSRSDGAGSAGPGRGSAAPGTRGDTQLLLHPLGAISPGFQIQPCAVMGGSEASPALLPHTADAVSTLPVQGVSYQRLSADLYIYLHLALVRI